MEFEKASGEIIEVPNTALATMPVNEFTFIEQAIARGVVDPHALEKLVALQERVAANAAADEYARAIAMFQAEMPAVHKQRKVMNKGGGSQRYAYAGFEDIMLVARPILAKYGISVMFSETFADGLLTITMRVRVGRHFEDKFKTAPLPDLAKIAGSMGMNEPQAFGMVLSYFKRYCLTDGFNIIVTAEDTDANAVDAMMGGRGGASPEDNGKLNTVQRNELRQMMQMSGADPARFWMWVDPTGSLTKDADPWARVWATDYEKCKLALQRKIEQQKAKEVPL